MERTEVGKRIEEQKKKKKKETKPGKEKKKIIQKENINYNFYFCVGPMNILFCTKISHISILTNRQDSGHCYLLIFQSFLDIYPLVAT